MIIYADFFRLKAQAKRAVMSNWMLFHTSSMEQTCLPWKASI